MGDDFNIDNASSTQSSNHGMNLTSGGVSGALAAGSGEMAEILLAHSMSAAQQHLKYATSFAGLSSNDGHMSMDYHHHHHQQQQQMHANTRLSLAGVSSNGEPMQAETKDALLAQTGSIPHSEFLSSYAIRCSNGSHDVGWQSRVGLSIITFTVIIVLFSRRFFQLLY